MSLIQSDLQLSYMRISTPCRSALCVHSQCFDATSWFSMMEQTTTYLCPVCEKALNYDDLIVDGCVPPFMNCDDGPSLILTLRYFDNILKESPESVEDVIVEANGDWHTSDNKYGSAGWKMTHSPAAPSRALPSPRKPISSASKSSSQLNGSNTANQNEKAKANVEILVLDSDDDDDEEEGRVKRELSPSGSSAINRSMEGPSLPVVTPSRNTVSQTEVIDLTLDSDDEEEEEEPVPPPPRVMEKRKAVDNSNSSLTDQAWKKARIDPVVPPTLSRNPNGHINGTGGSSHSNGINSTNALNALQMMQFDPNRELHREQSSGFHNRLPPPPVPRPSSILRPPEVPPTTARHPGNPYRLLYGSHSPPQPPSQLPGPGNPYQRISSENILSRRRNFPPFGGGQASRWL